jgi:hypothetical protein
VQSGTHAVTRRFYDSDRQPNSHSLARHLLRNIVQKEMDEMINKTLWIGLTLSLLVLASPTSARADDLNKKSILTFSQPFEIPGQVLPAGTYVFEIADTLGDRHIVRIFNSDRSEVIATVMTIPDYRLKSTSETVIKFGEVPAGSPEVMRAWFYPGNTVGEEFVYPKPRATQLARASRTIVPALAGDVAGDITTADDLKTARIVAVTPEQKEVAVTAAIQTTPAPTSPVVTTASRRPAGPRARTRERSCRKRPARCR